MKDLNGREITQAELDAYEVKLKEWNDYMDLIKPVEPFGSANQKLIEDFTAEISYLMDESDSAHNDSPVLSDLLSQVRKKIWIYKKELSEWEMKRSCDAPNRPGYYRSNND